MALTIGEVPKGKYDMPKGSWRFPMERQQDYKGVITFRPIRYVPPEIKTSELYNNFKKVKDQVSQYVENDLFNPNKYLFNMGSGGSGQGRNDGPGTDAHSYADPNLETAVTASKSIVDASRGVTLYLPQSIQYNDILTYEALPLGAIGAIGQAGIRSGQDAAGALYSGGKEAVTSMIDLITGKSTDQRAARLAAGRLAEALPIGSAGAGAVQSGFGVTVNPNTINLFRSVSLREFNFTFKLIASSLREAEAIRDIIKFFRISAYPDTINFDTEGLNVPIGYEFPDKFQIEMRYNNNNIGLQILPSILRAVQVTYNPSSMGWHKEGHASEVDLTLAFGEERTLNRKDIHDGY
jgi:hypothetical protein